MASSDNSPHRKRLVILVTEYYYFESHKQDLVTAARAAGFDVIVAAHKGESQPRAADFTFVDVPWRRSGSALKAALQFIPDLLRIRRLLDELKPDVLHNIAMKPAIIGSMAAAGTRVRIVNSINGLGFIFHARFPLARLAQAFCAHVLRGAAAITVFQNKDDLDYGVRRMGLRPDNAKLIRGSGVDPEYFAPQPLPAAPPVRFLMLARLLYMKGVHIAVEAHKLLRARGLATELVICGGADPNNPSSIPAAVIDEWRKFPGVTFMGQLADVRSALSQCHAVIHPALGGEGLPKALIEAAASGRGAIVSDIPGNREVVEPGRTGRLLPPGDAAGLADAMAWAADHPDELRRWGEGARAKTVAEFRASHIRDQHTALYRALAAPRSII